MSELGERTVQPSRDLPAMAAEHHRLIDRAGDARAGRASHGCSERINVTVPATAGLHLPTAVQR